MKLSPARRPFALTLIVVPIVLLTACLSPRPLTERPSPRAYVLPEVPLERWGDNTCGAGALATVMRHHGQQVSEEDLVPLLPTGRNGGVVSVDLLIAAKRYGFDAELIRGDEEAVRGSLEDGEPVILMIRVVNFPGVGKDLFHYIVLDGHDPDKGLYRAQFGDAKARWISLSALDGQWAATDYATLLLSPASDQSMAGGVTALRRAVVLEEEGRLEEAVELYRAITEANPRSAIPWLNLGNVQMKLGRIDDAEESYRNAIDLSPGSRDAMNNLAWLLASERRSLEEAELLARRAVLEPGPDAFLYLDTLGEVLRAQGKCEEAIDELERAVFSVPESQSSYRAPLLMNLGRAQIDCDRATDARKTLRHVLEATTEEALVREATATLEALEADR